MIDCTKSADCPHVAAAVDSAVRRVFATLGVDIDNPMQVSDFQASLRFSADLRRAADKSIIAFIGAVFTIVGGAIVAGISYYLGRA